MKVSSAIDPIDIGALRTLVLVYDLQSFSAAAERLDVNQSTVSYTIERLRGAFRDTLFVRQGNGIAATERCAAAVSWAREVIGQMESLASPAQFDPALAEGTVTVSCNHHERQTLIPGFSARLRASAPRVRLVLLDAAGHGKTQLKQNECDILLGPTGIVSGSYYRRHISKDHYVCIMDPANPLARGQLALSAYCDARHVMVTHNGEWQPLYIDVLKARGIVLEPAVILPSHDSLQRIIPGTDLIAAIPRQLALALRGGLHIAPLPYHVPINLDMYWSARTAKSGLHKWARDLLVAVAQGHAADGEAVTPKR